MVIKIYMSRHLSIKMCLLSDTDTIKLMNNTFRYFKAIRIEPASLISNGFWLFIITYIYFEFRLQRQSFDDLSFIKFPSGHAFGLPGAEVKNRRIVNLAGNTGKPYTANWGVCMNTPISREVFCFKYLASSRLHRGVSW